MSSSIGTKPRVLVAGATGTVGRQVVALLRQREVGVRVLARDPLQAAKLFGSGVEVVRGDLLDPASLDAALSGIEVASLATSPTPQLVQQETNFIAAARSSRLHHLVLLSKLGADAAPDPISAWHRSAEAQARASGIPTTVLRPTIFMSNLLAFDLESIKAGKLGSVFGDGKINFVDPRDVAELTARAITQPTAASTVWEFGGPEPLTYDDLAATLTHVLGYEVEHVRLDEASFRRAAAHAGLPDFVVEALAITADLVHRGKLVVGDDLVRRNLRRPARRFAEWLVDHAQSFRAEP